MYGGLQLSGGARGDTGRARDGAVGAGGEEADGATTGPLDAEGGALAEGTGRGTGASGTDTDGAAGTDGWRPTSWMAPTTPTMATAAIASGRARRPRRPGTGTASLT
jgi:hypothetical protein